MPVGDKARATMICCPSSGVYGRKRSMHIRPYKESDLALVISLWQRCELVKPWNDPNKDIQRKLAVGRDLFLVGEERKTLIAVAMGGYEGHRGWVNYLAVDPEKRGAGLGRLMMEYLEHQLTELGCPKINLQVRSSNNEVIAFYQALGYGVDPVTSLGKRLIPD
jgi:ribosomal protein S18 acetylase RimI-like enzyme